MDKEKEINFDKAIEKLSKENSTIIVSSESNQEAMITKAEVLRISGILQENFSISQWETMTLIFLLFLKSAANKGALDKLGGEIVLLGDKVNMRKEDLISAYKVVTRNLHLRRLAEYLATPISRFAENNNLLGDLFQKINIFVPLKDMPLSPSERACCSSFNQKNKDCLELFQRVYSLFAVEYTIKFKKKDGGNNYSTKKSKNPPRQQKKFNNPKKRNPRKALT